MNVPKTINYQRFMRDLYKEEPAGPATRYEPSKEMRLRSVRRGAAARKVTRTANALFDRLTRKEVQR